MDLSSLNVDVLLYLIKFIDPEDRFNLVLSGILKGLENANEGIDLRKRIEGFCIELGLRRGGTCQLEIRSLKNGRNNCYLEDESHMITLDRLAVGGYFQNNRQMIVNSCWPVPRLFQVIRYMNNLEKLNLLECHVTLTEELPQLFRWCPKLIELHLTTFESQELEMYEGLKNELRSGFQRLRLLELEWGIDSWSVIVEIFTWLKECVQLTVRNCNRRALVIDGSLTLKPDLSQNLRALNVWQFPVEFAKWILPFCSNIHTLKLYLHSRPKALINEIVRLKKLKDLYIGFGMDSKEIIRNCRQVEILRLEEFTFSLEDLADLEHNKNIREVHLSWFLGFSVKYVLPMLKGCTHLRRLTLKSWAKLPFPPFEELCDFIMELKHLTFLHFIYSHIRYCRHFKSEVDEVKAFVLPCRPNFKFYISCCCMFDETRISRTTTL